MAKVNRILSTAGLCIKNSTRLRSYCNLMHGSLINRWLIENEFTQSHVCFIRSDYLQDLDKNNLTKTQVIVVLNTSENHKSHHKYQINTPLTANKIKNVLNKISEEAQLTTLENSEKKKNKLASAFARVRGNIFQAHKQKSISDRKRKKLFLTTIRNKINPSTVPVKSAVLLGSPGSGKTSFVQSASRGNALSSEVSATDSVASKKSKTTVGIDYALVQLGDQKKLRLFGTPGQIKFNYIWDMVGKNADAFIILLDLSRPEPLSYLKFYLQFIRNEVTNPSLVFCAITHLELYKGNLEKLLSNIEDKFPQLQSTYCVDSRSTPETTQTLERIVTQLCSVSENINSMV